MEGKPRDSNQKAEDAVNTFERNVLQCIFVPMNDNGVSRISYNHDIQQGTTIRNVHENNRRKEEDQREDPGKDGKQLWTWMQNIFESSQLKVICQ